MAVVSGSKALNVRLVLPILIKDVDGSSCYEWSYDTFLPRANRKATTSQPLRALRVSAVNRSPPTAWVGAGLARPSSFRGTRP